jgi:hypothetical protein
MDRQSRTRLRQLLLASSLIVSHSIKKTGGLCGCVWGDVVGLRSLSQSGPFASPTVADTFLVGHLSFIPYM